MNNNNANLVKIANQIQIPAVELSELPLKLSKKLWISPEEFIETISGRSLAQWALEKSRGAKPALTQGGRRGPKKVYQDESIVLLALIQVAWMMGYESVIDYVRSQPSLARALGLPQGRVICASQYWQRRRDLGVYPFLFLFIALVAQLIYLGIIKGKDVIMDGTTLKTWFHDDPEAAWSFPKPWKGSTWGYKVHTLLCRSAQLPVMFVVTPANRQECVFAIPLLQLAVTCFGFSIKMVRADAGYFTIPIMTFIRTVLKASFMIDYNLRRKGKKALATLFFLDQWRFHSASRTIIERHFAWAKRYFGLEQARWLGLQAVYQHVALVYASMLAVAFIAHRFQRPDLAGSRYRVLAIHPLS